eukprot:Gb_04088 [translate_table: standard]
MCVCLSLCTASVHFSLLFPSSNNLEQHCTGLGMESDKSSEARVDFFVDSGDEGSEKFIEEQNEDQIREDEGEEEWLTVEKGDSFSYSNSPLPSFQSTQWPQSYRSCVVTVCPLWFFF